MSTASRTDTPLHNNEAKDRVHRIYYDPLDKRLRERAGSVIDTENEGRRMVPHITLTMPSMDTNMEK
ncbi:hypothetical protein SARC_12074 [Sphaeroforma arctica JP610]|uniref:Uncharacterized protein n=1 Tax=Sphaeroforma arctica JP610 TaxID=667725 RepID=A0A0L0FF42_9EUKA|nr:hypothetical protein SARC_12074 [Sphaeroforma arctica JP610]KNC75399.1 hypothetical protein SARC_12074 [Sphaeroforma arctica JP610]|eukprot:XP_014149301.1 hypothetical protein SARC_12074 [Sphaeroforma arctica JP610]